MSRLFSTFVVEKERTFSPPEARLIGCNMINDRYSHSIAFNRAKKTYTIRAYKDGKVYAKYRSFPMGADYCEEWTEKDIRNFLRCSNSYYVVK